MPRSNVFHPRRRMRALPAAAVCVVLWGAAQASAEPAPHPESVTDMFEVLQTSPPVGLPATASRALARLRARPPGSRVAVDVSQTRRIGPRAAGLYLIPAPNGICAVHASRGACSNDLEALSDHGIRFWVTHRRDKTTHRTPIDLYGALPDGLTTISASPFPYGQELKGTNAHNNGYLLRLPSVISWMILTGPRGPVTLGPLTRPG